LNWQLIVEVIVAAIAGGSTGYLSPWMAWFIEEKREIRSFRRSLIELWRRELLAPSIFLSHSRRRGEFSAGSGKHVTSQVGCGQNDRAASL